MFRCAPASYIKNICSSINATWWRDDGTSSLPPSPVRLSWQSRQAGAAQAAQAALEARPPPSPSRSEGDGAAAEGQDDVLVWDTERHQEEPGTMDGPRSNPIQGALSMPSLGGFVA